MPMRLLYFSPSTAGGLADYAREQANALAQLGVEVDFLSSNEFPFRSEDQFRPQPELIIEPRSRSKLLPRWRHIRRIMRHYGQLVRRVAAGNYRHILLGSYAEYLAPLWAWQLTHLAQRGVVFGAVVHDPVRDYVVGPQWWHRRSIASAYTFLREAFVHEPITLDTIRPMPRLRTSVIPHGLYTFPPAQATREETRRKLGIPQTASVWLSFGHIRDGKNLDLVIRVLARFPDAFLIVAGKEQSSGQKPMAFYFDLARKCGVAERCLWLNRFIAPEEVGNLFVASDLALLTYSRNFHSASGVLNASVFFRKPCLASSGPGNLQSVVTQYQLGIWVEPDREEALAEGLRRWYADPPVPLWDAYASDNNWRRNAEIVRERMFAPVA